MFPSDDLGACLVRIEKSYTKQTKNSGRRKRQVRP
jgi:hypothetical protein